MTHEEKLRITESLQDAAYAITRLNCELHDCMPFLAGETQRKIRKLTEKTAAIAGSAAVNAASLERECIIEEGFH